MNLALQASVFAFSSLRTPLLLVPVKRNACDQTMKEWLVVFIEFGCRRRSQYIPIQLVLKDGEALMRNRGEDVRSPHRNRCPIADDKEMGWALINHAGPIHKHFCSLDRLQSLNLPIDHNRLSLIPVARGLFRFLRTRELNDHRSILK